MYKLISCLQLGYFYYYFLNYFIIFLGYFEDAQVDMNEALKLNPSFQDANLCLQQCYVEMKNKSTERWTVLDWNQVKSMFLNENDKIGSLLCNLCNRVSNELNLGPVHTSHWGLKCQNRQVILGSY